MQRLLLFTALINYICHLFGEPIFFLTVYLPRTSATSITLASGPTAIFFRSLIYNQRWLHVPLKRREDFYLITGVFIGYGDRRIVSINRKFLKVIELSEQDQADDVVNASFHLYIFTDEQDHILDRINPGLVMEITMNQSDYDSYKLISLFMKNGNGYFNIPLRGRSIMVHLESGESPRDIDKIFLHQTEIEFGREQPDSIEVNYFTQPHPALKTHDLSPHWLLIVE